jgi:hypothetical protein
VSFQGLTLNNTNTGSNAGLISFTGTANTGCEVVGCRFETNEAAIYTAHASIVIRDNAFVFVDSGLAPVHIRHGLSWDLPHSEEHLPREWDQQHTVLHNHQRSRGGLRGRHPSP